MAKRIQSVTYICEECGVTFHPFRRAAKFCSRECRGKAYWRDLPEEKKNGYSVRMKVTVRRPDVVEKLQRHLHSDSNPFRSPDVVARAQATLKSLGHKTLNGGNGRGPTAPQQMLLDALGRGWVSELAESNGKPRMPGYPTCYKLDIAHQGLKVNVEVDGASHNTKAAKVRDAKRDALLTSRGWKILRVQNHQILTDLSAVLSSISKLAQATTLPPGC